MSALWHENLCTRCNLLSFLYKRLKQIRRGWQHDGRCWSHPQSALSLPNRARNRQLLPNPCPQPLCSGYVRVHSPTKTQSASLARPCFACAVKPSPTARPTSQPGGCQLAHQPLKHGLGKAPCSSTGERGYATNSFSRSMVVHRKHLAHHYGKPLPLLPSRAQCLPTQTMFS